MLEIFSGGCEPEVEGDDSRVVVAVGKQETGSIYLKGAAEDGGSRHGMHSVKVEAHRHNASISPKVELKVHVFLNTTRL